MNPYLRRTTLLLLVLIALPTGKTQAQTTPNPALLVGEKSGDLLSIVDPSTLEIVARVPANSNPHEVATDGRYAYVSNTRADAITVINLAEQRQVTGIDLRPMGEIHSLVMAHGHLYFANQTARTISRYNPATQEIDWVLGTGIPNVHMLAVSPDARRIFFTSTSAGVTGIIEQADNGAWSKPINLIQTGPRAEGLDLSPDGKALWVTNVNDSTLSIIDVATRQEIGKIEMPTTFSNRVKFTPDGRYAFVSELRGNELVVYDAATQHVAKRIDVGGGSEGIQMSPDGTRAFVAVSTAGKVVVIDLASLQITGEIKGFNNPDGMAWAERP